MRTKGIALISALVSILIITPIVYKVALSQRINAEKAFASRFTSGAINDALAVEMWARTVLLDDMKNNSFDSRAETWAQQLPLTFSDASVLSGKVIDLESKFNLNNIWYMPGADFVPMLHRLFVNLGVDAFTATRILNALQDWLDHDSNALPNGGAEDDFYLLSETPYRTGNYPMSDISEFKLIRGMTDEIYATISPYLTVLPGKTRVNINTASKEVLEAIFPVAASAFVSSATQMNGGNEYQDIAAFAQDYLANVNDPIPPGARDNIAVYSSYFQIDVHSAFNNSRINMKSIFKRDQNDLKVRVVNRYFYN